MTAQWHDTFIYEDENWDIAGIKGDGLFNPGDYGLNPIGSCSACWCGFLCAYKITSEKIFLDKLDINHGIEKEDEIVMMPGPALNGVEPIVGEEDETLFESTYENLNLEIPFTGGIVIATDFIEELYVHMGYHPAWKYKKVIELIFENGNVIEKRDVSERMKELREKKSEAPLEPGVDASKKEIRRWIYQAFKLDYE